MKLIPYFTILNQNFREMDLIREAMNKRRLITERLHEVLEKCIKPTIGFLVLNEIFKLALE